MAGARVDRRQAGSVCTHRDGGAALTTSPPRPAPTTPLPRPRRRHQLPQKLELSSSSSCPATTSELAFLDELRQGLLRGHGAGARVRTPSDFGKLNRLVVPKQHAERHFPEPEKTTGSKGVLLNFEDGEGKMCRSGTPMTSWTCSRAWCSLNKMRREPIRSWSFSLRMKKAEAQLLVPEVQIPAGGEAIVAAVAKQQLLPLHITQVQSLLLKYVLTKF